jgi:DNA-binding NarL/FixJ family response regulator
MKLSSPIRVLLVDDSPLVLHGIRAAIESDPTGQSVAIVGEAGTADAALVEAQRLRPDLVLLDLRLPDDSGLNVCKKIRELLPQCVVIVLTSSLDSQSVYGSVIAGAQGYLLKEIDPPALIKAIEDAWAGRPVFSGDIGSRVLEIMRDNQAREATRSRIDSLSPQERRVLAAMAEGRTNKGIAELMELSENTVKNYIAHIFEKLGVERRSQAVALCLSSERDVLKKE